VPHNEARDTKTFPYLDIEFSTADPYKEHTPYMIFPYFALIEFISYMGWIKVGVVDVIREPLLKGKAQYS
jgi:hypothetical protein